MAELYLVQEEDLDRIAVERCLKGDVDAFGTLVERYQRPVFNTVLHMVGDDDVPRLPGVAGDERGEAGDGQCAVDTERAPSRSDADGPRDAPHRARRVRGDDEERARPSARRRLRAVATFSVLRRHQRLPR